MLLTSWNDDATLRELTTVDESGIVVKADHSSQLISIALAGPATDASKVVETLDWIEYEVEEV